MNSTEVLSTVGERGDVRAATWDLRIEGLVVEPSGDKDAVVMPDRQWAGANVGVTVQVIR